MKKLSSILVTGAVVLSACSGPSVAATVNGVELSVADIEALIYIEDGTISKPEFAEQLTAEIVRMIMVEAAAADYGVEFTEAEIDAEVDRIYSQNAAADQSLEEFVAASGATVGFLRNSAHQNMVRQGVLAEIASLYPRPDQGEIDRFMLLAQLNLTVVCASHILLETPEDAQEALEAVQGGLSFADVAMDMSIGPSAPNGGDIGCDNPSNLVPPFANATIVAPIGEVYDTIVATEFGYHVILVNDRIDPAPGAMPTEDQLAEAMNQNAAAAEMDPWLLEAIVAADVTVDDQFGTWSTEPVPRVIPPAG